MAKEEMKIGEVSKPRFEFRSFGQCFCEAHKRMARLSMPVPEKVWERPRPREGLGAPQR